LHRSMTGIPGSILISISRVTRAVRMALLKGLFRSCGKNVRFDPYGQYSFSSMEIGSDVFIGAGARFSSEKTITIGNKVLIGPGVTVMGGDHNTGVVGSYMFDVRAKRPEDDMDVVIDDDVWIGACAVILKGTRIHRGAVVAAGAVVTRDVPAYSIVAGVPARVVRMRFTPEQIAEHERLLGGV
jgi:acetyltransferase-like isoleucine patch superfamily enzyme